MEERESTKSNLPAMKAEIRKVSEAYVTSVREIILHFQALVSARAHRLLMEAPGLYYPDLQIYVISKGGLAKGHASMHNSIIKHLPEEKRTCYAFVLYPETFVRSCLDRLLRKTTKNITKNLRISMENVFNRKYYNINLVDSKIEKELIHLIRQEL